MKVDIFPDGSITIEGDMNDVTTLTPNEVDFLIKIFHEIERSNYGSSYSTWLSEDYVN